MGESTPLDISLAKVYRNRINKGSISVEDVPAGIREAVKMEVDRYRETSRVERDEI